MVDDGSTDNSRKICEKFKDTFSNIKLITQTNLGQSVARNTGLKYAKGKYVNFLDSDDKLDENTLKEVFNMFNSYENQIDVITIPRYNFGIKTGLMLMNEKYSPTRM